MLFKSPRGLRNLTDENLKGSHSVRHDNPLFFPLILNLISVNMGIMEYTQQA